MNSPDNSNWEGALREIITGGSHAVREVVNIQSPRDYLGICKYFF